MDRHLQTPRPEIKQGDYRRTFNTKDESMTTPPTIPSYVFAATGEFIGGAMTVNRLNGRQLVRPASPSPSTAHGFARILEQHELANRRHVRARYGF